MEELFSVERSVPFILCFILQTIFKAQSTTLEVPKEEDEAAPRIGFVSMRSALTVPVQRDLSNAGVWEHVLNQFNDGTFAQSI